MSFRKRALMRLSSTSGDESGSRMPSLTYTEAKTSLPELSADDLAALLVHFRQLEDIKGSMLHMAMFLNYVITVDRPNELMLYLQLERFFRAPSEAVARGMYDSFFSSGAPAVIIFLPDDLPANLEDALNQRPPNLAFIKDLLFELSEPLREEVQRELDKYCESLQAGGGAWECAQLKKVKSESTSAGRQFVRQLLFPHIATYREGNKHKMESRLQAVHEGALLEFLKSHQIDDFDDGKAGVSKGRLSTLQKMNDRTSSGRKIHLHKGHHFVVTTYTHPTFCGHCGGLLWGLIKQGWQCVDCKFNIHKSGDRTGCKNCHKDFSQYCQGARVKHRSSSIKGRQSDDTMQSQSGSKKVGFASRASSHKGSSKQLVVPMASDYYDDSGSGNDQTDDEDDIPAGEIPLPIGVDGVQLPVLHEAKTFTAFVGEQTATEVKAKSKAELDRQEAIYEFVRTEMGYYRHLVIINNHFRYHALQRGAITANQDYQLFGNISQFLPLHRAFAHKARELQEQYAGTAIPGIGELARNYLQSIDSHVYALFCSNQNIALNYYRELESCPEYERLFHSIQKCEQNAICERLSYADFLAKPLQRLTKYPLLLKAILKNHPENMPEDRKALEEAITAAEGILSFCQNAMRISDVQTRLQSLATKTVLLSNINHLERVFIGDLSRKGRTILLEGALSYSETNSSSKDLHGVLCEDVLVLFQKQSGSKDFKLARLGSRLLHPEILMGSVIAKQVATNNKSIYLIRTTKYGLEEGSMSPQMYELIAESEADAKIWIDKITEANRVFESSQPDWEQSLKDMCIDARSRSSSGASTSSTISRTKRESSSPRSGRSLSFTRSSSVMSMRDRIDSAGSTNSVSFAQSDGNVPSTPAAMSKLCSQFLDGAKKFQKNCSDAAVFEEQLSTVMSSISSLQSILQNFDSFEKRSTVHTANKASVGRIRETHSMAPKISKSMTFSGGHTKVLPLSPSADSASIDIMLPPLEYQTSEPVTPGTPSEVKFSLDPQAKQMSNIQKADVQDRQNSYSSDEEFI